MSKKRLLVIFIAIIVVLLVGAALLILQNGERPAPAVSSPSTTPSPTVSGSPSPTELPNVHSNSEGEHAAETAANPILRALPYQNSYWSIDLGGSRKGKYVVEAVIFYHPGVDDPNQKIEQQKPYIQQFLDSTGQPSGTYEVEYTAEYKENEG